jgi:hypothetical protein
MSRKQSESIRRTVSEDFIAIGGKSFYAMTWAARDAAMAKDPALAARYAEVKASKTTGTATPEAPRKGANRKGRRHQGAKAVKKSRKRTK